MLESLTERIGGVFGGLKGKGRLSEEDIDAALRQIRLALLEADVNFKVVKIFIDRVKARALTAEVLDSLTPTQNVIKIVSDELCDLLGNQAAPLNLAQNRMPNVVMLVGLQGSGKTTAAAKLAYMFKQKKRNPLLVACDVYRPAAIDQLKTLGAEAGAKVYCHEGADPVAIATEGISYAVAHMCDVVIIDTAGRLHIDELMMSEAFSIASAVDPDEILMVVDAMAGQDVVNVAGQFSQVLDFGGFIMSKMDGDARGGAALSAREVTGKPIKFISTGEKLPSLEVFHPDRMAKRILGMGDVLSLIESAVAVQEQADVEEAEELLRRQTLTFDDFITMNRQIRKMGGVQKFISALPGLSPAQTSQVDDKAFDRMEVIINSMSAYERSHPDVLNGSRRARIAKGAGVTVTEVNQLVKKFNEMKKMMKKMMADQNQLSSKKKGKRSSKQKRNRRSSSLGIAGMSMADIKKLQDLMGR